MFKLFLHPTEKKSPPLLSNYLDEHQRIAKEFTSDLTLSGLYITEDISNPDLLIKTRSTYSKSIPEITPDSNMYWMDHCVFEFKFGMDLVNSLNSGLLRDELTRMKRKYIKPCSHMASAILHASGINESSIATIPLYLVIVNEWPDKGIQPIISNKDQARASTIAQDLNIRFKYCDHKSTFAKNVFDLIRTPPKPVDLGQRFVIKSSGSEWNRALQSYDGVSKDVANKIEDRWSNMDVLIWAKNQRLYYNFKEKISECFTTESGRFMKANMEKFLRKVSGK